MGALLALLAEIDDFAARPLTGRPQAVGDLANAAGYLRSLEGATEKVGVIGFCSGGRHTLLAACASDAFDAAVDCWGGMITRASPDEEATPARPRKPIDLVSDLNCPLYAVFGEGDANPSPEVANELERRLAGAGQPWTVEIFENAGHAFWVVDIAMPARIARTVSPAARAT